MASHMSHPQASHRACSPKLSRCSQTMITENRPLSVFSETTPDTWKVFRSRIPNSLQHDASGAYCLPTSGLTLQDFEVQSELECRKWRIFHAQHILSGKPVTLKVVSKAQLQTEPPHCRDRVRTEIEIHSRMRHPDIIEFLAMFHDENNIYLVMDRAPDGDLEETIRRQPDGKVDERRAAIIIAAIARALRYCHSQGVAHRDVKPANVLLGPATTVRLADFGLSKEYSSKPGNVGMLRRMHSTVGTPDYIAPETLFPRRTGYDQKCDMWSLGAMLYEMLIGEPPFFVEDIEDTYDRISRGDFSFPPAPNSISQDAQQLITALLHMDPKRRPTPAQVLMSRWVLRHCGPTAKITPGTRNFGNSAASHAIYRYQ